MRRAKNPSAAAKRAHSNLIQMAVKAIIWIAIKGTTLSQSIDSSFRFFLLL